jgi:hypothetical protein
VSWSRHDSDLNVLSVDVETMRECLPARSEYRSILIADIEGYSAENRTDALRSRLRAALRNLIVEAVHAAGIGLAQPGFTVAVVEMMPV